MRNQDIKKAALKTIAWFDLFDHPLTLSELHQYLYGVRANREDLEKVLTDLIKFKVVSKKKKLFFLKGKRGLTKSWSRGRYFRSKKLAFLKKQVIPLLSRVPFLKFVGVTGSVAFGTARKNSDIDLFIITYPDKVWTARFFINWFLDQKNLRDPKSENKICMNMLAPIDNLYFKPYFPKTYDKYYLATMIPIIGSGYEQVFNENLFIKRSFPNHKFKSGDIPLPWSITRKFLESILSGKLGDRFEKYIFQKQKKHIQKNTKKFGNEAVKIKKDLAKIHFISLGNKYEGKYRDLLEKIL